MTPSNDNRPAEFDAEVVRFLPGLKSLARARHSDHEPEDLAHSTVAWALEHWASRPPAIGVYPWLRGVMANAATERGRSRRLERAMTCNEPADMAAPACQESAVDVTLTLTLLGDRDRRIATMTAHGYTLQEVGRAEGVSIERARQLLARVRQTLQQAANDADARWARREAA